MKKLEFLFFLCCIILVHFSNCSRQIYRVASPAILDDKYDSEFPYKSSSFELKKISESIRKITSISYYKSYVFSEANPVTRLEVNLNSYQNKAIDEKIYSNSVIGTGTVIYFSENKVVLITCAHIVDFPDTVVTYFRNRENAITPYIKSIAFKQRQNNFVAEFPERGELEILAIDHEADLVVLGKKFLRNTPVNKYPLLFRFRVSLLPAGLPSMAPLATARASPALVLSDRRSDSILATQPAMAYSNSASGPGASVQLSW